MECITFVGIIALLASPLYMVSGKERAKRRRYGKEYVDHWMRERRV